MGRAEKVRECSTLERGCAQLGVDLPARATERLLAHLALLERWNRRVNLTAVRGIDAMVVRHLLDSLSIARFVRGESLLDIGSGAGFPGLPLAVVAPHLQVALLDSRLRRVEFLRAACAELQLDNVEVVHARVEEYRPARKFDTLAARAFAPLPRTLQLTAGLRRPGVRLLAMKGRMPAAEIAAVDGGAGAAGNADGAGAATADAQSIAVDSTVAKTVTAPTITVQRLTVPFLRAERHLIIAAF